MKGSVVRSLPFASPKKILNPNTDEVSSGPDKSKSSIVNVRFVRYLSTTETEEATSSTTTSGAVGSVVEMGITCSTSESRAV